MGRFDGEAESINSGVYIPKTGESVEFNSKLGISSLSGKRATAIEIIPITAKEEEKYYPGGVKILLGFFGDKECKKEVRADECSPIK